MFARTRRLTLRPGWPEDAVALCRAIAREEVVRNLAVVPWPYARGDAEAFLARPRGPSEVFLLILSHEADHPLIVGGIGISPVAEGHELGYWLTPEAWGRGYATEAGRAMVDIARHCLGLKRLVSGHFIDNPASGRVLTKLGFHPAGEIARRFSSGRGREVSCRLFEKDLVTEEETSPCALAA
jgi:RimJ/RimL family protein N-acetyltransferase